MARLFADMVFPSLSVRYGRRRTRGELVWQISFLESRKQGSVQNTAN